MLACAYAALADILTPPFRSVLMKSLALTVALLAALWIGVEAAASYLIDLPYAGLDTTLTILTGVGLFVGLGFLVAPVTSLLAGLFLDEIAEVVERTRYPGDPPGVAPPLPQALWQTLKFTGVVLLGNLLALMLLLIPGVNIAAFFLINGYLLGREYFEAAATRFMPPGRAAELRRANGFTVFGAGVVVAVFLAVPIVNLATPLFATALMVHLNKRLAGRLPAR